MLEPTIEILSMEPKDPQFPEQDREGRQQRIQEWELQRVKDYKRIVVNKSNSNVEKAIFIEEDTKTLLDLAVSPTVP